MSDEIRVIEEREEEKKIGIEEELSQEAEQAEEAEQNDEGIEDITKSKLTPEEQIDFLERKMYIINIKN